MEPVVHLAFEVVYGTQTQTINLCYTSASLTALMAHIVEGAALPASARPVPEDRASLKGVTDFPRKIPVFEDVEVVDCVAADAHIVRNMAPLYVHDTFLFSVYNELLPNEHGVLAIGDTRDLLKSLPHGYDAWWKRPGVLFPLLIRVDGRPAGFCVVESPRHDPDGADHYLSAFFLFRPYRRGDVGKLALRQVFDRFSGQWEIAVHAEDEHLRESCRGALSDGGIPVDRINYMTRFAFRSGE